MTNLISIIFYFKAGKKIGLGNLYRCRSLAIELSKNKNIKIIISTKQKKLFNIGFKSFKFKWLPASKIFKTKNNDIIVVDISNCPLKLQNKLKNNCKFLVGIDDWGKGPFVYDFFLRPNPIQLPPPKMIEKKGKIYQGKNYILLNPKFAKIKVKKFNKEIKNIFICFGGSDPRGYTLRVVKILLNEKISKKIKFILVVGPSFSNNYKLKNLLTNNNNFKIYKNPKNIIKLYNLCDVAIISGGYLLYEACALGKPSIVLMQEKEQHNESKIFERKNAIIRAAYGMRTTDSFILKAIKKLLLRRDIRYRLYTNCQKCISRKGSELVSNKIIKHYWKIVNSKIYS